MKLEPFSPKQLRAMCWWCPGSPDAGRDAVICDGAVRSGKTLCLGIGFAAWASRSFHGQAFAFCGRTIRSLKRNLLNTLLPALRQAGFGCAVHQSENWMELSYAGRKNRFYFFGGKDEGSAALIQGMTLAGVLLDEVALMPRSFVEQALARCSVDGSKFWFNCNPEHPQHWFYQEWILQSQQKNALYLHFTMQDNPALSPEVIARYEQLYSGAFYERFIRGRWVAAQGLVYPFLTRAMLCEAPANLEEFRVSCDYGTVNPASFGLWGKRNGVWYRIDEYYYDSRREGAQRTDEEHYAGLVELCGGRRIECVVVDPLCGKLYGDDPAAWGLPGSAGGKRRIGRHPARERGAQAGRDQNLCELRGRRPGVWALSLGGCGGKGRAAQGKRPCDGRHPVFCSVLAEGDG